MCDKLITMKKIINKNKKFNEIKIKINERKANGNLYTSNLVMIPHVYEYILRISVYLVHLELNIEVSISGETTFWFRLH